jgi:hypothetical protein
MPSQGCDPAGRGVGGSQCRVATMSSSASIVQHSEMRAAGAAVEVTGGY